MWATLFGLGASVAAAPLQKRDRDLEVERPPAVDPYTEGEPAALEAAGYVSFGPFPWGDRHDTRKIEEVLGGIPLLWVETEHFKIGSGLHEYPRPVDKQEKHKLKEELQRLKQRLPAVKERTKALDPWLRLHLLAQRCEELYDDFAQRLGLEGDEFLPGMLGEEAQFLGQGHKYLLLVTEKKSDWSRYASTFLGVSGERPQRTLFHGTGSLFYGVTPDLLEGAARNDSALHCLVAHGVVQNLVDGFRAYHIRTPLWFQEGIGHWYARRTDPRWSILGDGTPQRTRDRDAWKWEPKVRGRVHNEVFPSFSEMLGWDSRDDLGRTETMMLWSRVDYLLTASPGKARAFLDAIKEPLEPGQDPDAILAERALPAFRAAWGELDAVERSWCEHVLAEYATR